ncbi:MAG: hypothetical protein ACK4TA_04910 [Saprospiraceae bacterium]
MPLLNWTPDEGQPYYYPSDYYLITEPTWKILKEDEANKVFDYFQQPRNLIDKIELNLTSYVWCFHLIEHVGITKTISDLKGRTYLEDFADLDFILTTYIDYPFHNGIVEVKILPIKYQYADSSEFWVGYIFWQISKVYAEIYKNHWQEVGVYGHCFGDLAFSELIIDENYIAELIVES